MVSDGLGLLCCSFPAPPRLSIRVDARSGIYLNEELRALYIFQQVGAHIDNGHLPCIICNTRLPRKRPCTVMLPNLFASLYAAP